PALIRTSVSERSTRMRNSDPLSRDLLTQGGNGQVCRGCECRTASACACPARAGVSPTRKNSRKLAGPAKLRMRISQDVTKPFARVSLVEPLECRIAPAVLAGL